MPGARTPGRATAFAIGIDMIIARVVGTVVATRKDERLVSKLFEASPGSNTPKKYLKAAPANSPHRVAPLLRPEGPSFGAITTVVAPTVRNPG